MKKQAESDRRQEAWITNGDFETGELDPWLSRYPDNPDIVKVVQDDGWVLYLAPASQAVWQNFPTTTPPGKDLVARFRARTTKEGVSLLNVFMSTSAEGAFMGNQAIVRESTWTAFVVPLALAGHIAHALYFAVAAGGVPVHIDDVELEVVD